MIFSEYVFVIFSLCSIKAKLFIYNSDDISNYLINTVESRFKKARFKKESRFKKDCWDNLFFST